MCTYVYRLKECGETMLVEMSEVLFNELAFFKLMQNMERYGALVCCGMVPSRVENYRNLCAFSRSLQSLDLQYTEYNIIVFTLMYRVL